MNLNKVYNAINENNIKIFPFGIDGIKAVTIETENKYGIFLNHSEIKNKDEEFCVLAHEYGHCTTGSTHRLYSPLELVARHEYRADRKAILDFLPFEDLNNALTGCNSIEELSEKLDLPCDFVYKAIKHYQAMNLIK